MKNADEPGCVQADRIQACILLVSPEWSGRLGVLTNYRCHKDSNMCDGKDHVISFASVCQSNFTVVLLPCDTPGQFVFFFFPLCHLCRFSFHTYGIFVSSKQFLLLMRLSPRVKYYQVHIPAGIPCIKYILAILVLSIKPAEKKFFFKKGLLLAPADWISSCCNWHLVRATP